MKTPQALKSEAIYEHRIGALTRAAHEAQENSHGSAVDINDGNMRIFIAERPRDAYVFNTIERVISVAIPLFWSTPQEEERSSYARHIAKFVKNAADRLEQALADGLVTPEFKTVVEWLRGAYSAATENFGQPR